MVSIFVNPAQFAPNEDFGSYPRTWNADLAALSAAQGRSDLGAERRGDVSGRLCHRIEPGGPAKAGLEDTFRPHFFGGVATVVAKLLLAVQPDFAMFGEKDYQQLKVVTAMARDLDIRRRSSACRRCARRTASRCRRATPTSRRASARVAPTLYRALKECAARIKAGEPIDARRSMRPGRDRARRLCARLSRGAPRRRRWRRSTSLKDGPMRLLVAAKLGRPG